MLCLLTTAFICDTALKRFYLSRSQPTYRTLAVDRLNQGPVDVIVIGSSHIRAGVNPSLFPFSAVNLAESGCDYRFAELLCNKFWDRVKEAKVVILELDAVPVYQDTISLRKGDFSDFYEWGFSPAELPIGLWNKINATVLLSFSPTRFGSIWPEVIQSNHPPDMRNIGPGYHGSAATLQKLTIAQQEAFFHSLGDEFGEETVNANLSALSRLVTVLQAEGISVVLLQPPFHEEYWKHPSSIPRGRLADLALRTFQLASYQSIDPQSIDYRFEFENDESYFSDWTHLSSTGATQLSRLIGSGLTFDRLRRQ